MGALHYAKWRVPAAHELSEVGMLPKRQCTVMATAIMITTQ